MIKKLLLLIVDERCKMSEKMDVEEGFQEDSRELCESVKCRDARSVQIKTSARKWVG